MENKPKLNGVIIEKDKRNKQIVKVSIIGIIANIFLSAFKATVGAIAGSIAIILDAVNNISDAASSIITIVGTKLANKEPDKEHPFGHGRAEYLTAMVISVIIIYAGITSLTESIKKIIKPTTPDYSIVTLIIIVVAIIVKIVLGMYVKNKGKELNSTSLINSGEDAKLDSIISLSTLVAAIIFIFTKVSLEAYLGIIISLLIIKSGIEMIKEAISSVLGERVDSKLIKEITKIVLSFEEVKGAYDLVLNNYGPNSYTGSVHIEIIDTMTADLIDKLQRDISAEVYEKTRVILTAIGIYSVNTKNKKVIEAKTSINKILKNYKNVLQFHGFYFEEENKKIRFDVVVSFEEENKEELFDNIYNEIKKLYPDYDIEITPDTDYSVSI